MEQDLQRLILIQTELNPQYFQHQSQHQSQHQQQQHSFNNNNLISTSIHQNLFTNNIDSTPFNTTHSTTTGLTHNIYAMCSELCSHANSPGGIYSRRELILQYKPIPISSQPVSPQQHQHQQQQQQRPQGPFRIILDLALAKEILTYGVAYFFYFVTLIHNIGDNMG
eukprot:UN10748